MNKSRYPVSYAENNLIRTKDGVWWAYYELLPYNYSFLGPEKKLMAQCSSCPVVAFGTASKRNLRYSKGFRPFSLAVSMME